jgi:signal transduction histidine kinase
MNARDSFSEIAALSIHDVKNNLAQLAAEAEARGDTKSLDIALSASETLTRLLCFYKSEIHQLHLQIDTQDPHELIEDLLSHHASKLQTQTHLQIVKELSQAPTLWFYDKTLIQMILANALQNALRYARKEISISVIAHQDYLEICVQDDGIGYPLSVLESLNTSSPVTAHGTGLGLGLAQRVLALHTNNGRQGEIILSNQDGAKFQMRLP